MLEFINEFRIREPVKVLHVFSTSYDGLYVGTRNMGFKVAAALARQLTQALKIPVASFGNQLVSDSELPAPEVVTVVIKVDGIPRDVEVKVKETALIRNDEIRFDEAAKKLLNRRIDLLMAEQGFVQEGRDFIETKGRPIGRYSTHEGIVANCRVQEGIQTVIVDPVNHVRSKINLLEALKDELAKMEIHHWKDAVSATEEINKKFRSRAYSLRSNYPELHGDELGYNIYRFIGFDFSRGLSKTDDPRNPVNFHSRYGRQFSMDQPIVRVTAKGGYVIDQIPSLLEEHTSMQLLKRFGASQKFQSRSLMDAKNRYYMTTYMLEPMVKSGFVERLPEQVQIENFGPVTLTVEGDYLVLKNNYDFQKFFEKRKLLREPSLRTIHVFSPSKHAEDARKLVVVLLETFKDFGLTRPQIVEHLECPQKLDDFTKTIVEISEAQPFAKDELALVVYGFGSEDVESLAYGAVKKESFRRLFPVQVVNPKRVTDESTDLRKDIVNPLFVQIIAKCGGQPYGLQPGFVPRGTLFVGIDHYRNPFKQGARLVTSIVLFDHTGNYVNSNTALTTWGEDTKIEELLSKCFDSYLGKTGRKDIDTIVYIEDTGIGTRQKELEKEATICERVAKSIGAKYVFAAANKGLHLRLYSGDRNNNLSAKKVSAFVAAIGAVNP